MRCRNFYICRYLGHARLAPPPLVATACPGPPKEGELHCLYNQRGSSPGNGQIYLAGGSAREGVSGRRGGPPPPPPPKEGELHGLYNQQDSDPCNGQIYLAGGSTRRRGFRQAGRASPPAPSEGGGATWPL
jgi:hypothetical protein